MPLLDSQGQPVVLGRELARGGEGTVFGLRDRPNLVVKCYLSPIRPEKVEKLRWMVSHPPTSAQTIAAWPVDTVHTKERHKVCGFIMPKVDGYRSIHLLSATASRRKEFPDANWGFLVQSAFRLAEAFEKLHNAGHLMADVNESNVLVSPRDASIRLIDCDSFQITTDKKRFLCDVGVPYYTAPELQGQDFRNLVRTPTHDCFGLAVLLFQLLFLGRHPFTGVFRGQGDMTPQRAIAEFRFAYGRDARRFQMEPPPVHLPLTIATPELVEFFERSFSPASVRAGRPAATDWRQALAGLLQNLRTCSQEKAHRYPAHLSECPWCRLLATSGIPFFVSVTINGRTISFTCKDSELAPLISEAEKLLSSPLRSAPALPTLPAPPSILPPSARAELVRIQQASAAAAASAIVAALALWAIVFGASVFGIALLAVALSSFSTATFVWWQRHRALTFPTLVRERHEAFAAALGQVRAAQSAYEVWLAEDARHLQAARVRLHEVRFAFTSLQADYEHAKQRLLQNREAAQRKSFLRSVLIEDHDIDGIKDGLKRALVQSGIESAYDVLNDNVRRVYGFGEVRAARLLQWAREVEISFRFNAAKEVNPTELNALVFTFQQKKATARTRVEAEIEALRRRAKERQEHSAKMAQRVERAQEVLVAAAYALPLSEGALVTITQRRAWESEGYWATVGALFALAIFLMPYWRNNSINKISAPVPVESSVTSLPQSVAEDLPKLSPRVLARSCILREVASAQARPIVILAAGTTVHVETTEAGWSRADLLDGRKGYIGPLCFVPLRPSEAPCTHDRDCESNVCLQSETRGRFCK